MKLKLIIFIKCNAKAEFEQKYLACTRIEKAVRKEKGIENTSYTGGTNADITAFADWEESQIEDKVYKLKQIPDVEDVIVKRLVPVQVI